MVHGELSNCHGPRERGLGSSIGRYEAAGASTRPYADTFPRVRDKTRVVRRRRRDLSSPPLAPPRRDFLEIGELAETRKC